MGGKWPGPCKATYTPGSQRPFLKTEEVPEHLSGEELVLRPDRDSPQTRYQRRSSGVFSQGGPACAVHVESVEAAGKPSGKWEATSKQERDVVMVGGTCPYERLHVTPHVRLSWRSLSLPSRQPGSASRVGRFSSHPSRSSPCRQSILSFFQAAAPGWPSLSARRIPPWLHLKPGQSHLGWRCCLTVVACGRRRQCLSNHAAR
ncbi:hypothetical protein VTI74DRAFT_4707 [Chaetomium olivicolor]